MRVPVAAVRWGVGDQVLSSVTNFAILILVARSVGSVELGIFAIFTAGYSTVTYVNESLISEPFVVRYSRVPVDVWRARLADATACAILLGGVCALGLAAAAVLAGGTVGALLALGAVCAPGLLLQDALRFAFFAAGRQRSAFLNDLMWGLMQLAGFLFVEAAGTRSLILIVATWSGAGAIAGTIALRQARVMPRPRGAVSWLRRHHDLWRYILMERLSGQGAVYLSLVGIGAAAGLAAVAAVRAAQALFGPLYITINAARLVMLPSLVTASAARRRRLVVTTVLALVVIAAVCGAVITMLPGRVGTLLFGSTWPLVAPLLIFVALGRVLGSAAEGFRIGLVSAASVRRSLAARLVVTVAVIGGMSAGAAFAGARGAVIAEASALTLGAAVFACQFFRPSQADASSTQPWPVLAAEPELVGS